MELKTKSFFFFFYFQRDLPHFLFSHTLLIIDAKTMATDKSKVAIGFIAAGALTLMFGIISAIIGPTVMKNQVVKVSYVVY